MFSKRNPMKYFSGNAFARLPLYKLVAGGSAVVLTPRPMLAVRLIYIYEILKII